MVMRYLGGINSPSYNPLAANVTTGVTTVQDGGVYTTSSAAQASGVQQWVNDPYFGQTVTLLQADNFANGSQNNTFRDSSTNNFTVTRNGNTTQGTFSPFSTPVGYWNNFFDGTGDYLQVNGSSNLAFGTNDFTIECFFQATSLVGFIYDARNTASQAVPTIFFSGTTLIYYVSGANRIISGTVIIDKWYHLVVSRVSGNTRMFLDGVQTGSTYTDSTNYTSVANRPYIGNAGSGTSYFSGYISNLRVLNGTGTTAPVVPVTALTAITNTQLLTCQNNRFIDNSANNYTISKFADVSALPYSAFNVLPQNTVAINGGSMYFDGTGDYLSLTGSSNLAFGTSDFTIELFAYFTSVAVEETLYDGRAASTGSGPQPCIVLNGTSTGKLSYYVSGATRILSDAALTNGQWYHIVLSRVSSVTRMFINGVAQAQTWSDTTTYTNPANRPIVGVYADTLNAGYMTGYISNLRVLNGTGVTSVTIPTAPLTAITNTQLLLSGTNAGISDASGRIVGETVGNAQVSTFIKKYGSGSMAFDGSGDWLLVPHNADLNFGTGDFTVECWLNLTNTGTTRHLIGKGTATTGWAIYFNANPTLFIFEYGGSITYSSNYNLTIGQWYHLAVTRSGSGANNLKMFINGFLIFESTVTTNLSTTNNMYVGASRTATNSMFGYIDDLRITKGVARYTNTFIPPATAMPRQGLPNL